MERRGYEQQQKFQFLEVFRMMHDFLNMPKRFSNK